MPVTRIHKTRVFNFRTTDEQVSRIEALAEKIGENPSEVLRRLIDSATIATPVLVSSFNQHNDHSVQHGR